MRWLTTRRGGAMICGVIDIGSNTIRLSTYEYDGERVRKLFHKKSTAGLAGYIKDDYMELDGIDRCCQVLEDFKETIELLPIDVIEAFATASLRNIRNSSKAVQEIRDRTGYNIQLLSGAEEAEYGYCGISSMYETGHGMALDIGGGSTEITLFEDGNIKYANSFPIGSLNMYKKNVSKILPSEKEKQMIKAQVKEALGNNVLKKIRNCGSIIAMGGSARAILKLANSEFDLPADNLHLELSQLEQLKLLLKKESKMTKLILQTCPDRIHTLIPGLIILEALVRETKEEALDICPLGVREGYLFKRILGKVTNSKR